MPYAPAKPCIEPRCPNPAQAGRSRCTPHQRQRDTLRQKASPHRRVYQTSTWKGLRLTVLREEPFCPGYGPTLDRCGKPTAHVDHIVPLQEDESRAFDRTNLRAYCPGCHSRKTMDEMRGLLTPDTP